MKRKSFFYDNRAKAEVIAEFGDRQLVNELDGKLKLLGGSVENRQAATEWVHRFMPEIRTRFQGD